MHIIIAMYRAGPKIPHASSDRRDATLVKRAFAVPAAAAERPRLAAIRTKKNSRSGQGSFACRRRRRTLKVVLPIVLPWAYLSLTFVFAITPGATTAMVVSHTLAGGRKRGLLTSLGALTANATQATLAVAGVSALIVKWPEALYLLKIGGALFLAWCGFKSLRRAIGGAPTPIHDALAGVKDHESARPFHEGFMVNMLNVSITSFYIGVVPNFLHPGTMFSGVGGLILLYAAHILIAFSCHVFWITLFFQARALFTRERPRRLLDATFGVLLIALAIRIVMR
jgi:threonine/homoserine/homoserine lactone efflux protein